LDGIDCSVGNPLQSLMRCIGDRRPPHGDFGRLSGVDGVFRVAGVVATTAERQRGLTIGSQVAGRWPFPQAHLGLDTIVSDLRGTSWSTYANGMRPS